MIISHKHKFIFIKTEKTAGTSLEIALSGICGEDDIISPISRNEEKIRKKISGRGAQNYALPFLSYKWKDWKYLLRKRRWARLFYNHMPASEIRKLIPEDVWKNYYKFCFERNPFDKVVSHFHWVGRKSATIAEFIETGKPQRMRGFNLYTENGVPVVDRIYKYEEMDEAIKDITDKIGLDSPLKLPKYRAKGNIRKDKRHYRDILSGEEVEQISKLFSREMELLGYTF